MADLDYAVLADFARVDADGTLTVVGAHRTVVSVQALPAQHVLAVAGRVWVGRREPSALLTIAATTPVGDVGVVAEWTLDRDLDQPEGSGRASASFAAAVVAPLAAAGGHAIVLSLNGEVVRHLPFSVVAPVAVPDGRAPW